jgi:hypothetical protein
MAEVLVEQLVDGRLRELAGPDLLRDNAFRVLALPTTVDRRAVRARRRELSGSRPWTGRCRNK